MVRSFTLFPHPVGSIQAEQVRLLYSNASFGYLATAVNAILLTLVQWSVIPPLITIPWLAYMLVLTVVRLALARRFHELQPSTKRIAHWGNLFGVGAALSGAGWGTAGFLLFPDASVAHQVFVAFVLGGMIAGAVGLLAARMIVFLGFVVPTAAPIVVRLLTYGEGPAAVMAGMGILFTLVMVFTAWKFHEVIASSLHLRFENSDLVETLTSEKATVEQLNSQLKVEIEERQNAEVALQAAHVQLEGKVKERTAQLESAVDQLRSEMEVSQRLDEQLQQAQKMETVGRLAGGVAHDFNNLLTVMQGYAELARSSVPNTGTLQNYLEGIQTTASRAADLTQQLLAFSRRQIINPEAVVLNDILGDMEPMLTRVINENIEIEVQPAPELWTIWADRGEMQRVIMNLAVNGRDAMPEGGKLTVATKNVALSDCDAARYSEVPPGEYVLLTVSDTGMGIPEEIRPHIFEPFFTTKNVGQGTGLGLSSCYGIVAQAGGYITFDSEVAKGTTMKVLFPRKEAASSTNYGKDGLDHIPQGNETVLVVEDEPILRKLICQVLRNHGYRVLQATDGAEALAVSNQDTPLPIDLLVTDIVMPQMGGLEMATLIQDVCPNVRTLFVSGYSDAIDIEEITSIGGEFLKKPFLPDQLVTKIREVLDSRATAIVPQ